jgi:Lamin Tail Domain
MRHLSGDGTHLMTGVWLFLVPPLFPVAVGCAVTVSCAPRTDLYREAANGGEDPAGGSAAGALVDPPAGATDVPSNLAAVTVRLPSAIRVGSAAFRLRPADGGVGGGAAALGIAAAATCAAGVAGDCYRLPVGAALVSSRSYLLELLSATSDPDGAAAPTGVIGAFDTGAAADQVPPQVIDFAVAIAGPCVEVRFSTDEPVEGAVVIRTDAGESVTAAGAGLSAGELAVPFAGLPPGARAEILLRVVDRAGNAIETSAGALEVPPETPPLAITEVLANPAGPEPGQEFVELRNLGEVEISLAGLRLEDAKGADVLPEAMLAPGAYALVVPSSFDPQSTRDVAPRPGTLMVPVDARLGSDGLSNAGEVVRLRMAGTGMEPIVSSYGGWVDVSAASAAGKSAQRMGEGRCDQPSDWTRPARAPTPGWGIP